MQGGYTPVERNCSLPINLMTFTSLLLILCSAVKPIWILEATSVTAHPIARCSGAIEVRSQVTDVLLDPKQWPVPVHVIGVSANHVLAHTSDGQLFVVEMTAKCEVARVDSFAMPEGIEALPLYATYRGEDASWFVGPKWSGSRSAKRGFYVSSAGMQSIDWNTLLPAPAQVNASSVKPDGAGFSIINGRGIFRVDEHAVVTQLVHVAWPDGWALKCVGSLHASNGVTYAQLYQFREIDGRDKYLVRSDRLGHVDLVAAPDESFGTTFYCEDAIGETIIMQLREGVVAIDHTTGEYYGRVLGRPLKWESLGTSTEGHARVYDPETGVVARLSL